MAAKQRAPGHRFYTVKSYQPEETLGFMLGRCMNCIVDAIDKSLEEFGITSEHFGLLHAIYRGKASNPSELARLRYRNSAAITYVLDVLEEKKLLLRTRSAQDRRVVVLELTEEGKALTRACIPLVVEAQNSVLSGLSRDDYATLGTLLRRAAGIDEIGVSKRTSAA